LPYSATSLLYSWMERGQAALAQAFAPPVAAADAELERDILTLLVEGHASYRGVRRYLRQVGRRQVSLGTISAVVQEAARRALALVARTAPPQERAVARDEIYGRDRRGAYLNVVDVESGAVWAAEGPVPVDGETWTLVLWLAQERGLRVRHAVSDGGGRHGAGAARGGPMRPAPTRRVARPAAVRPGATPPGPPPGGPGRTDGDGGAPSGARGGGAAAPWAAPRHGCGRACGGCGPGHACKFHRRIQHFSSGEGSRFQALHTRRKEPPTRVKRQARGPGDVLLRRYNPC